MNEKEIEALRNKPYDDGYAIGYDEAITELREWIKKNEWTAMNESSRLLSARSLEEKLDQMQEGEND